MKRALVLVDLQAEYLGRRELEPAAGELTERAARLLAAARAAGVPVIHVRTVTRRESDRRLPHWKRAGVWPCEAGSAGHATPAAVDARAGEPVVEKSGFSGFAGTALADHLRGVDAVIVAGVLLHACVRQTALDACQLGFDVTIATDATGSDDPVHGALTRQYLEARAVRFTAVAALAAELGGAATVDVEPVHDAVAGAVARAAAARANRVPAAALSNLTERIIAESDALATSIARETGKPIRFARGEVDLTVQMLDAIRAREAAPRDGAPGRVSWRRRPHGVVAVITPFNNPLYIALGKLVPATLHGNAVVWKPAPEAAATSARVLALLEAAGWPPGMISALAGGRRAGQALLADPRVRAATLTGSSAAGFDAQATCARRRIPLQAELGGNNAALVWSDADLDVAAAEIAAGAFDCAGQRCTANRRVVVHRDARAALLDRLVEATRALAWGDPLDPATRVGPLVSAARRDRVAAQVERAAVPALRPHRDAPAAPGAWLAPVILTCDAPDHEIVQEESFGPVLVVQTAASFDEALALVNGVRQGLVASVFTRSGELARRFLDGAEAGLVKVGQSTAGAAVDAPFGGWKGSGVGPPEHGVFDREFYTRPQTVYTSPEVAIDGRP